MFHGSIWSCFSWEAMLSVLINVILLFTRCDFVVYRHILPRWVHCTPWLSLVLGVITSQTHTSVRVPWAQLCEWSLMISLHVAVTCKQLAYSNSRHRAILLSAKTSLLISCLGQVHGLPDTDTDHVNSFHPGTWPICVSSILLARGTFISCGRWIKFTSQRQ